MKNTISSVVLILCSHMLQQQATAQDTEHRWMFGARSGMNVWINAFDRPVVGDGWRAMLRYGVAPSISFAFEAGYEELKSGRPPGDNYIKLHSFPVSVLATVHLSPGNTIAPFVYFGVGGMLYLRKDGLGERVPKDGSYVTSMHLPGGLGIEIFPFSNFSFAFDAAYTFLSDETDFAEKADSYVSLRGGLNWYFSKKRPCENLDDTSDDPDKDNLSMEEEERYATDPCNPDTDGDGLKDGDEVNVYRTDPVKADSDGDGLPDGAEVMTHMTKPLDPDTDRDGLSDGDEVLKYKTNPLVADTDGDGLSDGEEVLKHKTNPLVVDTDGDGLSDGDEVTKHGTSPVKADTDGDGCSDGEEILTEKTDPLVAGDCPPAGLPAPPPGVKFEPIYFSLGKDAPPDDAETRRKLDSALTILKTYGGIVEIIGHADSIGSDAINDRISLQRADTIKNWLIGRGIDPGRLITVGRGRREPVDPRRTQDAFRKNRRVVIVWQ